MGEGTGEEKIRREDGDGKVRLGECQADHSKDDDFMFEIVVFSFFVKQIKARCAENAQRAFCCQCRSSASSSACREGEMFSGFQRARAGTVSFSSGTKARFWLAGSWAMTGSASRA